MAADSIAPAGTTESGQPGFPHSLQEKRALGRKDDAGRFRIIQATLEEHQLA
jgi:hypothetical protein